MALALETVLKELSDSGIIAPGKLENFVPPKAHPTSVEELVGELVKQNHLTEFQAQEIAEGRAKSLIMGEYTLLDRIGAGGMGQVFKAQHRRMKREVAIKTLPPKTMAEPASVARFEREVEAAAKLRHPNIVAADDAGFANGVHFLVMEYVAGNDLSALVKKSGPLPIEKAVNYILQAARGLDYAHKHGVVHRDIKPGNLLVDAEGTVKILDMGLAKIEADGYAATQSELTGSGSVFGTIDYMAPEQARSTHHADARADIYSLGCSLYYLIVGRALYAGETITAKLLAHQSDPIPQLDKLRADVTAELEAVFQRMVAKTVENRYQTMSEVILDLQSCSPDGSISRNLQATQTFQKHAKDLTGAKAGRSGRKVAVVAVGVLSVIVLLSAFIFSNMTKDGSPTVEVDQPDLAVDGKVGQPVDLLKLIDLKRDAIEGIWKIDQGALLTNDSGNSRSPDGRTALSLPVTPKNDYQVRVIAQKHSLTLGSLRLGILVNGQQVTLNVGGGGSSQVVGLEMVDGHFASSKDNPTSRTVPALFLNEHSHTFLITVRGPTVEVEVDGKQVIEYAGGSILSLSGSATREIGRVPADHLFLASGAGYRITKLEYTPLVDSKPATLQTPASLPPSQPLTDINSPAFQAWMKSVAALPAEEQIKAVSEKLVELNPGFDGVLWGSTKDEAPVIDNNGVVTFLSFNAVNVLDISPVRALAGLQRLNCSGTVNGVSGLSDLSALRGMSLRLIDINFAQVTDISPLAECKSLTKLTIRRTKVPPASIAALQKALPNCKITWDFPSNATTPTNAPAVDPDRRAAEWVLSIGGKVDVNVGGRFIKTVAGGVETTNFIDGKGTSRVSTVEGLPSVPFTLRVVTLSDNTQVKDDDMSRLVGLIGLSELKLNGTAISDNGLDFIQRISSLTLLGIARSHISDKGFDAIANLRGLGSLGVVGNRNVTDVGIKKLAKLPSLARLNISETEVTGAALVELPHLRYLTADIRQIATLPNLEKLESINTYRSDESIKAICQLRLKSLKKLHFSSAISAQQVEAIKSAYPNCTIDTRNLPDDDF